MWNGKKVLAGIFLALILALPLGAFGETPAVPRSPSAEGAEVGFANIEDGDVLPPVFTVRFSISGMGIAPAGVAIDNTGHHHLLIDIEELPDMNGPLPATDRIRHFGKGQSETTLELPEGTHTLQLLLADHAHLPHDPPVMSDVITITVDADAPPQAAPGEEGAGP
ncbi:MAG: DUF4399 domain-containing protein [Xanthomonadales bacterium]|nr:DUF4399 domain-containing protein [Gammaproteobacteria bacterium]NNJ64376.1 DUF4399 domain-containing protein [Xanthomonadales bacterium]